MVQAGKATDATIDSLLPLLDDGDILIDGGNTNYQDTIRRNKALAQSAINFIGMGVSGGEIGALTGPSLMPVDKKKLITKLQIFLMQLLQRQKTVLHVLLILDLMVLDTM